MHSVECLASSLFRIKRSKYKRTQIQRSRHKVQYGSTEYCILHLVAMRICCTRYGVMTDDISKLNASSIIRRCCSRVVNCCIRFLFHLNFYVFEIVHSVYILRTILWKCLLTLFVDTDMCCAEIAESANYVLYRIVYSQLGKIKLLWRLYRCSRLPSGSFANSTVCSYTECKPNSLVLNDCYYMYHCCCCCCGDYAVQMNRVAQLWQQDFL